MTAEPITQEKAPKFTAVPLTDIPKDAVPDSAPKRRGRPPRDPNAPPGARPGRKPKSMEYRIGAMLIMVNAPIMAFLPGDALSLGEINALAQGLDAQAASSPRFRKYLNAALEATSGGQLVTVSAVIVARRLARHDVLPKALDEQFGKLFEESNLPVTQPEPESPSNGTD